MRQPYPAFPTCATAGVNLTMATARCRAAFFSYLLLGETLTARGWLGAALIIGAALAAQVESMAGAGEVEPGRYEDVLVDGSSLESFPPREDPSPAGSRLDEAPRMRERLDARDCEVSSPRSQELH